MARPIEVPVVVKKGSLARSIEGEATTAMRKLGGSSTAVQPLGRMLGKIRADADEFTKSIEASNARVIAFGASVGVINGISNAFKSLVTTTIKVEKSMADINVVLGASQKNLAKFGDGLFKVAKNTAQSFEAVSEAALEFSRQGLTMEETLKRTNDALILTRLTGLKAADSVKGLTAAVNGFGKAGLTTTQIINKLSAVDTKFAVGTDDLINALGRAGAVAQDAGVNFDELVALVTVAQQKTARGGAVIGNAFKTIYTRMQDPKALQALRQVGVAVDDVTGAALPANRVLQNLAQTYDTLNRSQKATLDQFVAGKFQINILKSVLGDLNTVNGEYARAQQVSINATDQAIQKNDTLNKTMAALATQSGLALDELAKKVGDLSLGPGMRNILQSFNALVEGATKGLDGEGTGSTFAKGLLRGIGGVLTGPGLFIIGGVFIKLFKDLTVFGVKSLKNLLGLNNASKQQAALQQGIGQLLSTNLKFQQAMAAAEGNIAKQAAITQRFLASEVVLRERAAAASAKLAASAYAGGFGVSAAGMLTRGRSRGRAPSFAPTGGKVPNFAASAGMRQYIEGSTFNAGALPDIAVGGTPTGRSSATVDQFFKGSKLIKANSLTKAAQIGREGFTKTGWRLFHEFGLHKRFGGPVARSPFPGMSGAHPPIASIIGSTNETLPFSGAKDARKFYREAFSTGPAREAGITRDGLRLMRKGRGFEQDPIGAFKQAIKNSGMSQAAAAKMRQPYFEGGLESAIFKRNSALKEHSGKNFIFDMARDTGGGRYRMMDVKNTLSSENYSNLVTKKMRALNLPGFEESHHAQEKMFHKEADKLGTQQRKARKLLRFRGVPMSQVFQRYIQSFAPNFSPLSDAVQREKMQVGSMMGISPSSVQTRVVQNSSLKSSFNPQGFGVISPTVGQHSFADAARMHRGEDLRTTNLPNFAGTMDPATGKMTYSKTSFEKILNPGAVGATEVKVVGHSEKALKSLEKVYSDPAERRSRLTKGTRLGGMTGLAGDVVNPPSIKERVKRRGSAALTAAKGAGGAAMGPLFTGMMMSQMAGGFFPEPGIEEQISSTPEQRRSRGRTQAMLQGGIAGGTAGWLGAGALKAMGRARLATPVGLATTAIGIGYGAVKGGESLLTPQQLTAGAQMQQEKAGTDISRAQQIKTGLMESAGQSEEKRAETAKRIQELTKSISDPAIRDKITTALESGTPVSEMDTVVTDLVKKRSSAGRGLEARSGLLSAATKIGPASGFGIGATTGFSEQGLISTTAGFQGAGVTSAQLKQIRETGFDPSTSVRGGFGAFDKLGLVGEEVAEFKDALKSLSNEQFKELADAMDKAAASGTAMSVGVTKALQVQANAWQDFQQIRDAARARGRSAQIDAATYSINEQTRGIGESDTLSRAGRIGGASSTISMRARFARGAVLRQQAHDVSQLTSRAGAGMPEFARTPGANLDLVKSIEKSLKSGEVSGLTDRLELARSTGTFGGNKLNIEDKPFDALVEWSRTLENSVEIVNKSTDAQKNYIKEQEKTAKLLQKDSVLLAGIEGFRNSLQDAFTSIADPSLSGGDIARNFAMGILGSIQQQASSNVADFVSGSLFGDFFKKKDKQSGGIISAQNGMYISGGRSGDKNPAMLEDGEYVLNRNAVKMMGGGKAIDAINFGMAPRFAGGGVFSGVPSKHRKKALEKFGYSSFSPSTGGSTLGGGGMSMGLDYFDPRLSSLAHANDPTLQAMRGVFREEKQKDIAEKFQKQANNDALVQKVVGAVVSAGLSYGVGKIGAKMKDSKLEKQALADESEVFAEGFDFSPIASLPTAPTGGAPTGGAPARPGTVLGGRIQGETLKRFGFLGPVTAPKVNVYTKLADHIEKGASLGEAMRREGMTTGVGNQDANPQNTGTGVMGMGQAIRNQISRDRGIAPHERGFGRVSKNDQKKLRVQALRDLGGSTGITPYPEMVGKTSGINLGSLGAAVGRAPSLLGRGLSAGFGALGQMSRNMYDKLNPMILTPDGSRPTRAMDSVYSSSQGYIGEKGGKFYILQQHESGQWGHSDAQLFMNKSTLMNSLDGRKIPGYQRGGSIDNIPAMLTGGEFVVNAGAVKKYGSNTLNNMNRFQTGGMVGSQKFVPGEDSSSKKQAISEPSTNNNTVNISINPGGGASVNANEDFSGTSTNSANQNRELGRKIKNAVLEVIQTEKRIGGSLRNPYAKEQ